jgi:bla regulator protein blaR1
MNIISQLLPPAIVKAIGWTLLHSLWQGLAVALLLALLLVLLRRSPAAIRYFMATGAMLTFTVLSSLTFVREYRQASIPVPAQASYTPAGINAMGLPLELTMGADMGPITDNFSLARLYPSFQAYFLQHLPLLVLIWVMGVIVLLIRFAGGYAYTQRLKHYKTIELPLSWQQTLHSLAVAANISRPVKLLESALVKVPMMIGYIKPVILLPLGTIAGLPPEQVEAILAHELAHIYRKDYLVNIFQCIIEIIFFYHPGIWWISSRIREEREHCCDDLALSICGNSLTFAKALANLEQVAHHTPSLAMGFPARGRQLLIRIKRLGNAPVRKPDFTEGFLAACFVMLSISAISVSTGMPAETKRSTVSAMSILEKGRPLPAAEDLQTPSDTTKNTFTFKGNRNGKRYHIEAVMEEGEIIALTVNGRKVPSAEIAQYRELVFELMGAVPTPPAPVTAVLAPAPHVLVSPEPVIAPHPLQPLAVVPAMVGHLAGLAVVAPAAPLLLAPMPPEDISYLLKAAFEGDTSRKVKGDFVYQFTGKKDKTYKITIKDGVLTELKVDGKKIPESEYNDYLYLIDEIRTDAQAHEMELYARQEELLAKERELMQLQLNQKMEHIREMQEMQQEAINRQQERQVELQLKAHEEALRKQEAVIQKALEQQESAKRHHELAIREHEKAMARHEESARLSKMLIETLNTQLLEDKLIVKGQTYYIQISPKGLFIDSVKQPDQVFEKYKSLLEKKTGKPLDFTMQYHYNED